MESLGLKSFFEKVNYDWEKDLEDLSIVCNLTKTRVNSKEKEFRFLAGMEQPFLIKAVAEWLNAKRFFEIGTGRGTSCYAVSLCENVEKMLTVDIIPHDIKKREAIGFKPAHVSNADLYEKIPFEKKEKIEFCERKEVYGALREHKNYDFCFIDGDHSNPTVIMNDYVLCRQAMKARGIIIWDDYDPNRFAVKDVLEYLQKSNNKLDCLLVESRGHLFEGEKEQGAGMVLMKEGKIFE